MRWFPLVFSLLTLLAACKDDSPSTDDSSADADGDGSPAGVDCDDNDPAIHPDATEVCDGLDNDCDDLIDDADDSLDPSTQSTWYTDADADFYGDPGQALLACAAPSGSVAQAADCDDSDPAINPAADEVCDGLDNDCDALTDDDDPALNRDSATLSYRDADEDGYGDPAVSSLTCSPPAGYLLDDSDCDDADPAIHPAADEVCDGLDNDCDLLIDDDDDSLDPSTRSTWYTDADADGHGDPGQALLACAAPSGSVALADDCDDADSTIHPDAIEVCDGVDDDCDLLIDDADPDLDPTTASINYRDADQDGYGDPASITRSCVTPSGYTFDDTDCDDTDGAIHPAASEVCDGLDNDCDNLTDDDDGSLDLSTRSSWYADADNDGYGDPAASLDACDPPAGYGADSQDCDDNDRFIHPGAAEICEDGLDNDCDGSPGSCVPTGTLGWADTDILVTTSESTDFMGYHFVSSDLDLDGYTDLVVGSFAHTTSASVSAGVVSVVYGPVTADLVLPTDADAVFEGVSSGDNFGVATAAKGDLNGDGSPDLAFTAPDSDDNGTSSGTVYLLYGGPGRLSGTASVTTADASFLGDAAQAGVGRDVNFIGDLDGDGYDELAIGADQTSVLATRAGSVYVIWGDSTLHSGSVTAASAAGFAVQGTSATGYLGDNRCLSEPLDADGDGLSDLWMGAPSSSDYASRGGAAYLLYGDSVRPSGDVSVANIGASFVGNTSDYLGDAVGPAGDLDGDGYTDLGVGAYGADVNLSGGSVYVIPGGASRWSGATVASGAAMIEVYGATNDGLGPAFSATDIDGDGFDDLLVGVQYNDTSASNAGSVLLYYGPLSGQLATADADLTVLGSGASDRFGSAIYGADVNGDGYGDLVGISYWQRYMGIVLGGGL